MKNPSAAPLLLGGLLYAPGAHGFSYGRINYSATYYPNATGTTPSFWDSIPADSATWKCLNETSANDNDYMRYTNEASQNRVFVRTTVDTTDFGGALYQVDSIRVVLRGKDDGAGEKIDFAYDTSSGSTSFWDTLVCTSSFVTKTSRKVTGLTKSAVSKLRVGCRNNSAVASGDTLWV